MKLSILGLFLLGTILANFSNASACSYQIDEKAKKAELTEVAKASLGLVKTDKFYGAEVTDFKFWESKPTPMCPEELTYELTSTLRFKKGMNDCLADLKVVKIEPWNNNQGAKDVYEVSGRASTVCKKQFGPPPGN